MRDLGAMGENYFKYICANAGLSANGSEIDRTGWDFFVEFPFESKSISNVDLIPSPIECRVQVKATDNQKRKIQITLSNLLMLAKSHTPSFIYFIEFDRQDIPQRSFLLHLDNNIIFKILKKAREVSVSTEDVRLNKKTMTISYDNSCLLSQCDGASLKNKIKEYIGKSYSKYVLEKINYLKKAGYENGCASMSFTVPGVENIKDLIDSSLGISKKAIVSNFTATDTRFGLKSNVPFIKSINGTIEFGKVEPLSLGRIIFKESHHSNPMVFDCKLYNSPLNSVVAKELVKIKIEGDFFNININLFTGKTDYSFQLDSVLIPLHQLKDAIKLIQLISSSNKKCTLHLDFDGFPKAKFNVNCNNEKTTIWKYFTVATDNTLLLANRYNIPINIKTSIDEIDAQYQKNKKLVGFLKAKNKDIDFSFAIENRNIDLGVSICAIHTLSTELFDRKIIIIISLTGNIIKGNDDRYKMKIMSKKIEKEIVSTSLDEISTNELDELIESISKKHQKKGIPIITFR